MTTTERARIACYWASKAGTDPTEWEDAAAYAPASGWFAVADGASTSGYAQQWAFTLTSRFVGDRPPAAFDPSGSGLADWMRSTRRGFDPEGSEFPASDMPAWVHQAGRRTGAFATLLAGRIGPDSVDAAAVGDTCLFRVGAGGVQSFPLTEPEQFGVNPALLCSRQTDRTDRAHVFHSRVEPGDVLLVCTDALSEFLMRRRGDTAMWSALASLGHEGFAQLCRDVRRRRLIKNDDITMLRIVVPPRGRS